MSAGTKRDRPAFSVEVAKTKDELEACWDLRVEVFIVEQGFSIDDERDQYEEISQHFLLTVDEPSPPPSTLTSMLGAKHGTTKKPVGTVRFTPSIGKVSRLVVLKEYRQYGFGRELMQEVARHAATLRKEDVREAIVRSGDEERLRLKLHSQMQVIPFYKSMGYTPTGDVFDEDGAPHQKMVQDIRLASDDQVNSV